VQVRHSKVLSTEAASWLCEQEATHNAPRVNVRLTVFWLARLIPYGKLGTATRTPYGHPCRPTTHMSARPFAAGRSVRVATDPSLPAQASGPV
jgi:hypothetical protein